MAADRTLRVRLDDDTSRALKALAKIEGENESVVVRRLIRAGYLAELEKNPLRFMASPVAAPATA